MWESLNWYPDAVAFLRTIFMAFLSMLMLAGVGWTCAGRRHPPPWPMQVAGPADSLHPIDCGLGRLSSPPSIFSFSPAVKVGETEHVPVDPDQCPLRHRPVKIRSGDRPFRCPLHPNGGHRRPVRPTASAHARRRSHDQD